MLVMERHREEATMDRQLTVIAGMDGAYRSELILDWLIRDRAVPTIKLFLPKRNRNVLARKLFLSLFYSLLEVFARPDDDSCMTGLNLDVVHPSEARPDPTINCFCTCCFHYLWTTCHNAAASSLPICTDMWIVSSLVSPEICFFDRDSTGLSL